MLIKEHILYPENIPNVDISKDLYKFYFLNNSECNSCMTLVSWQANLISRHSKSTVFTCLNFEYA